MLKKILGVVALVIEATSVSFRVAVKSTECLLALTRHVRQHKLLFTADELTKAHPGKDFKVRCD
jgi:hypothetical protein